ncbi:hypothetical protein B9Z19DRAFT_1093563 [Tuber borchii]|uniref:Succinate dehydrogenase assembly factor 4, mitochondrial n=1 Tax=Tuber borchii TaxID=42251 RepID=A0A2T6ZFA1_TUBBO|nr:hypothetical protein B9Z19DRAFT_1093563 [Tuber borchii]
MLSQTHFLRLRLHLRLRPLTIPPTQRYSTAQKEFEALQKAARDSFFKTSTTSSSATPAVADVEEDMLHPDARRGAKPEFEGDVNPKTGERGGPKNDPLRYGDWAFNGRVSDF